MTFVLLGVRLRWRLTRNRLRKGGTTLFVVLLLGCALLGFSGLATFASAGALEPEARRVLLVLGFTLLVLGWVFVPLLGGGADETVDPTRLALLPLRRRDLAALLAGAASSGPAALAVLVALAGVPVGLGEADPLPLLLLVLTVPVVFLLGLGVARLVSVVLVRAQRSRRGRDLAVLVSGLAGIALWLATQSVGPLLEANDDNGSVVVDVLAWLPPGWAARSVLAAADGRAGPAAGWLALTLATALVAVFAWAAITARLLTASERTVGVRADDRRPPLGTASTPWRAALAKEFRYLRRSPGKRVQFMLGTLMGVGFAVIQVVQADAVEDPRVVFFALWGVIFTISGCFNVLGFDSGSLWLEVVTGGIRRAQLVAKTAVWLPVLLFPPVLGALIIATWTGHWRYVPTALALAVTAACCGLGVGAVVSTVAAMPQTDGDNPFSWRQGMSGRGCVTGALTILGLVSVGILAGPIIVPCLVAADRWWAPVLALAGVGYGGAIWWAGVAIAARRTVTRGPEFLAELSPRSLT